VFKTLCLTIFTALTAFGQSAEEGLRVYNANCAACHGQDGDTVPGVALRSGQFRRANNDGDLTRIITAGIPGTAMPAASLNAQQVDAVIAYLRTPLAAPSSAPSSGDASRGRALFEGKGGCLKCHRVNGNGSRMAPDLSDAGALRNAAALERSIVDPGAVVLPQHMSVRAVLRDGTAVTGRRLNEDTLTIQLIDSKERLVSLNKSELRDYTLIKTTSMPSYRDKLSSAELADIVTYLLSLKGSNTP
jgi:cytochrome c oxidase cbb3-type subunit III